MSGISVTEQPLLSADWVYPCTPKDIQITLQRVPARDIDGLESVRLVRATERDCSANGRYFFGSRMIYIYSYRSNLMVDFGGRMSARQIRTCLQAELQFGMELRSHQSRWIGAWSAERLRAFVLGHVLLHEIGHHVYDMRRMRLGLTHRPNPRESEQFAEAYAVRTFRKLGADGFALSGAG